MNAPYKKKGRGLHLSATRVKLYDQGCPRKWAAQYVKGFDGKPPKRLPPTPAMTFGTEFHRIAEEWLRDGTVPPNTLEGATFRPGIKHWPEPGSDGLMVEVDFDVEIEGGLFQGQADVVMWDGKNLFIGDHKTTSSIRWAMDATKLSRDPQALFYAKIFMDKYGVDEATLKWVYYERAKNIYAVPNTVETTSSVTREAVDTHWNRQLKNMENMLAIYGQACHPSEVEANENFCYAYNRECPFKGHCDELKGYNMRSLEELRALSKKKQEEKAPAGAPPTVVKEEATTEEPKTVEVKTTTRPSKAAEQKATIAALEAIKTNLDHLNEMQRNMQQKYDKVLDKLLASL
jgi:hypothetical protein